MIDRLIRTGIEGLLEVYVEDAEEPLGHDSVLLIEHLSVEFAPLHVAKPGKIATTVRYQRRHVEHPFRPSATTAKVTRWAVGKLAATCCRRTRILAKRLAARSRSSSISSSR